jgi:mannose/fructose/sorbose-specific phosphotransferase system IIA component
MSKKVKILILSHGKLAQALTETAELIIGKNNDLHFINLTKEKSYESFKSEVENFVNNNIKFNIIIFLDMIGGTCYNVCCEIFKNKKNIKIFSGVNLPVLLETVMNKDYISFPELIMNIKKIGSESIVFVNERLDKCKTKK